jgi:hypothetical protein
VTVRRSVPHLSEIYFSRLDWSGRFVIRAGSLAPPSISRSLQKKTAAVICGGYRGSRRDPRSLQVHRLLLREDDLDTTVLRFAYPVWCRNAQVILAAAGNYHVAARHTEAFERGGDGVGAAFGEPLVVAGRP